MSLLEAFSEKEKWLEVQPPARRAYAPEGTAKDRFLKSPLAPFIKGGISSGIICL